MDGESAECLKISVPRDEILPGGVPIEWVEKIVVLDSEDIRSLHVNAIEINLRNVTLAGEWDGRVAMKIMGGGSSNVPH